MDVTQAYWACVSNEGQRLGWTPDKFVQPSSSSRPLRARSLQPTFVVQALNISQQIHQAITFINRNAAAYLRVGRSSEQERDQLEEEVGLVIKESTAAIEALRRQVELGDVIEEPGTVEAPGAPPAATRRTTRLNETQIAHRHGILLSLNEHLAAVVEAFQHLKAHRYRAAAEARQRREEALRAVQSLTGVRPTSAPVPDAGPLSPSGASLSPEQQAVQQVVMQERAALLQEFTDVTQRVRQAESTIEDISQLSSLLSEQVVKQAGQIEAVYKDALAATFNIGRGNKELKKTVDVRRSSRLHLAVLILVAAAGVAFMDWFHS